VRGLTSEFELLNPPFPQAPHCMYASSFESAIVWPICSCEKSACSVSTV